MRAYNGAYLDEIVETQGELFENVSEYAPGIDVKNFIEEYMGGKTREYIDRAEAYACTMDAEDLWEYFQWYYNISSRELVKLLPLDFMIAGYRGLHDLDLELAVRKVGGQCGYEENHRIS